MHCELCAIKKNECVIFQNELFRIISAQYPAYPGYVRLIVNKHVKEMSDLPLPENYMVIEFIYKSERLMRDVMHPDKINIASLGNIVPHVHWHIIPRFFGDEHFPNPIWGEIVRSDYVPNLDIIKRSELFLSQLHQI